MPRRTPRAARGLGDAKHPPVAWVARFLGRMVADGQRVDLDASPSTVPDGDALTFTWWRHHDADSVSAKVPGG